MGRFALEFVNAAKNVLTENPSFQSWIFELDFISRLRLASKRTSDKSLRLYALNKSFRVVLVHHIELFSQSTNNQLKNNTVFFPLKWNQGCFDVVYYELVNGVMFFTFFQCTIAQSHHLNFQYVALFLAKFIKLPAGRHEFSDRPSIKVNFIIVTRENSVVDLISSNKISMENVEAVNNYDRSFVFLLNEVSAVMYFEEAEN